MSHITADSSKAAPDWIQYFSQFMALLLLLNTILCLFNLSYLSLRPFYNQVAPAIVHIYDPVKGIMPQPLVQRYLESVDQLSIAVSDNRDPSTELRSLQQQSVTLLTENPFAEADQDLAQLKQLIRQQFQTSSSIDGLVQFWRDEGVDNSTKLQVFDQSLQPILARAYARAINQKGEFVDYFWYLDNFFLTIFAINFVIRVIATSYQHPNIRWTAAMIRHWYDALLFLPFWRWLRIIPTVVRLHQSRLINLDTLINEVTHEPAAYVSERVTQFLLVRVINQLQETLCEGKLLDVWPSSQSYIQLGESKKLEKIVDRLLKVTIYRVLPEVQPSVEELLRHAIKEALKQSEVVQGASLVPGVSALSIEAINQLSSYLSVAMYQVLAESYADDISKEILDGVYEQFQQNLRQELHAQPTQWELKQLLVSVLEEIKVNYLQRTSERDPKVTLSEVNSIQQSF